jgi:DNA modification methylase
MEFHPIASIFPLMDDESLDSLAADIKQNGLREPIWLFEGKVLDGRNRSTACLIAGVKPETREFAGTTEDAVNFVWSINKERRHLQPGQLVAAALKRQELLDQFEAETKAAVKEAGKRGGKTAGKGRPKETGVVSRDTTPKRDDSKRTTGKIAKATGTSHATVARTKAVKEGAPDLFEKIETGELDPGPAYNEMRKREKKQELKAKAAKAKAAGKPTWEIRHADCITELPKIKTTSVRLVFADPPYNIGIDYGKGKQSDSLSDDAYLSWCWEWIRFCVSTLADNGSMWVMINDEYADEIGLLLTKAGLHRRAWIKWYETFGVNCSNNFNRCSRHIFYCVVDPKRFIFNADAVNTPSARQEKYNDKRANPGGKIWDDVWTVPRLTGTCEERIPGVPTQVPLEIMRAIVGCASDPGDVVLDPFCGSGSTGAAAIELGRQFIGIEQEERFCEIGKLRLAGI